MNTRKTRSNVNDIAQREIKRLWGDIPVIDADHDLRVFIMPEDVNKATRKDPGCCVFAQACKRLFGSTKVLFFKSIAYVELPNSDGSKRVERFELSPNMRGLIEAFDKGETVIPEAGFLLKRIRPSDRFDSPLNIRRRENQKKRAAAIKGTNTESQSNKGKGKFSKPPIVLDLDVRSGIGMVHFTKDKKSK